MTFDPVAYANEELVPMTRALCELAEQEGQRDQQRFFASILVGLERTAEGADLIDHFMQLSMSAFVGFEFSAPVALLLDQLLAKAQPLSELMSLDESEIN